MYCSVLQFVAVCCNALQCSKWNREQMHWECLKVMCCSVLQCVAVCCNVLQCSRRNRKQMYWEYLQVMCCSVLQCVAVCCNVSQGSKWNRDQMFRERLRPREFLKKSQKCPKIQKAITLFHPTQNSYVAVCCSVLQCVAVCCSIPSNTKQSAPEASWRRDFDPCTPLCLMCTIISNKTGIFD